MKILTEDNPVLFEKAALVEDIVSDKTQKLIDEMITTSTEAGGYGLAAPQIGIPLQIFVYRKSTGSDKYKVVINPKIVVASGKRISKEEGCLSHPGFRTDVRRAKTFIIKCLDRNGKEVRLKGSSAKETIILQHEYDHLVGITIKTKV